MKNVKKINHLLQEGILFLVLSGALLGYSLEARQKAFNKDWSQSPYLFPMLISAIFAVLSLSLICQGVRQWRVTDSGDGTEKEEQKRLLPVLVLLGISLLYYLSLGVLKLPYITFGIFAYEFTISNFEIVTAIFLVVVMLYLGVRRVSVLVMTPVCFTLFLSIAFRALLHVMLP